MFATVRSTSSTNELTRFVDDAVAECARCCGENKWYDDEEEEEEEEDAVAAAMDMATWVARDAAATANAPVRSPNVAMAAASFSYSSTRRSSDVRNRCALIEASMRLPSDSGGGA